MRKLFRKIIKVMSIERFATLLSDSGNIEYIGVKFKSDEVVGVQPGDVLISRKINGEYKYFIKEDLSPEEERVRNILRGKEQTNGDNK